MKTKQCCYRNLEKCLDIDNTYLNGNCSDTKEEICLHKFQDTTYLKSISKNKHLIAKELLNNPSLFKIHYNPKRDIIEISLQQISKELNQY